MTDVMRVQGRITAFWDAVATSYESDPANVPSTESPAFSAWTEAVRSVLPAAPSCVLDVGTGTGLVARIAAGLGHQVTGLDLAEAMLTVARAQTALHDLDVDFVLGDAVAPPFLWEASTRSSVAA